MTSFQEVQENCLTHKKYKVCQRGLELAFGKVVEYFVFG